MKITDQIQTLHGERLQPYNLEFAKDGARAGKLVTEFESTIHTPAMVPCFFFPFLLLSSTNIPSSDSSNFLTFVSTLAVVSPGSGPLCRGCDPHAGGDAALWWPASGPLHPGAGEAEGEAALCRPLHPPDPENRGQIPPRPQEGRSLSSTVAIHCRRLLLTVPLSPPSQASRWYSLVLHENFLQDLLSGLRGVDPAQKQRRNWGTMPAWRHKILAFLGRNPAPLMEELVHLAHLANIIPDEQVQQAGKQLSHR